MIPRMGTYANPKMALTLTSEGRYRGGRSGNCGGEQLAGARQSTELKTERAGEQFIMFIINRVQD